MRVEEFLERSAQCHPDKTALVCGGERWSYRLLEEQANRLAHALLEAGIQRGDRVGIGLENSVEAIVSLFAVLKAGGVFFIVSPQVNPGTLVSTLSDSGAVALIAREGTIASVRQTAPRLAHLKTIVVPFEEEVTQRTSMTPPRKQHDETDLAALVYTSGSTGGPKGVMLTHRNMTSAAASICTYLENTSDDVILNVMPLAFTYGLGQVTTAFRSGATLVLERSFAYPLAALYTLQRERVTGFPLVPTIATLLLQQDLRKYRFPHLRYITNAAAALSGRKIQQLRQAFPGTGIFSMYGQTECQRVSYLPPSQLDARPGSVGIAIPGTEVYIVNERGERVAPGTVGELVVRGPHVMRGYWNQPEATSRALRPGSPLSEPVLHTGDLFRMDDQGWLYFVGRTDDMIKTRGEKVPPREIEELIAKLPGVAEVAVCGIPDDILGEAIAAVVTPSKGAAVRAEDVKRHCMRHLPAYMVPKFVGIQAASLPTTTTGKVSRHEIRAMAAAAVEVAA